MGKVKVGGNRIAWKNNTPAKTERTKGKTFECFGSRKKSSADFKARNVTSECSIRETARNIKINDMEKR